RPGTDWVGVAPPLCTTWDEADEIAAILEEAIEDGVEESRSRGVEKKSRTSEVGRRDDACKCVARGAGNTSRES
ncbi:MAG: hypothetical protein ACRDJC_13700, partial [Thermomicrobiales bacterium]